MFGPRRGALALVGTLALLGLSGLGTGAVQADESTGSETPLQQVSALVQPGIVYLQQDWAGYVYDKQNKQYLNAGQQFQVSFQCTGFVVNPDGYIATAGHCVDQAEVMPTFYQMAAQWAIDNGYYVDPSLTVDQIVSFQSFRVETMTKLNRADLVIQVGWGAAASGIETAQVKRARVIGTQKTDAGDLALLKVEATDLNALSLTDQEVEVGTEVVSIGYPVSVDTVTDPDLNPSFKSGSISSVKTVQGGLLTVYEISAAVSGGMSGGPTVNLDGEVVGVNSFGITGESQAFNFVRPADQLSELLADEGVDNVISPATQAYRDGLKAFWDGDKATAVDQLSSVVADQPSNKLAAEYLTKARDLPDPPAKESSSGTATVVVLVLVLGLVAGAVVVVALVLRARRRGPTAPRPGAGPVYPLAPPPPPPPPPLPIAPPSPVTVGTVVDQQGGVQPQAMGEAAPASQSPGTPKFCGNCGAHSHPREKFCEECGEPLVH